MSILRHASEMKPKEFIAEALKRWIVNLAPTQAHKAKISSLKLIQRVETE